MSDLYGISNVDRREDIVRQYKSAHESVAGAQTPQDRDGDGSGYFGGNAKKKAPQPQNDSDGIGDGEHHDFDVTV